MPFAVFLCKPVSRSHIVVCTYMHTPFICLGTSLSRPVSNDSQVGHMVTTAPGEVVAYYNRTHFISRENTFMGLGRDGQGKDPNSLPVKENTSFLVL